MPSKKDLKTKRDAARERARTRAAKSPTTTTTTTTTKNTTVLKEAREKRERDAYERRMHEMNQANLPAWARDGWRPLQPGEVQIDDVTTDDERAMTKAQRSHNRMMDLLRAITGNHNTTDIYMGPGSRNRGR